MCPKPSLFISPTKLAYVTTNKTGYIILYCDRFIILFTQIIHSEVTQSCPILGDPMDCSPPGSSIHGMFQARILEWVAISFSKGTSWPRGSNLRLLHCRQMPYRLSHKGSHRNTLIEYANSRANERLHFHFSLSCFGEGNGNPLQYSCLENPRHGGTWWAAVYGVAQSWTRLKWLSSSSSMLCLYQRMLFRCLIERARSMYINKDHKYRVLYMKKTDL